MISQKLILTLLFILPLSCGNRSEFSVHHLKWLSGTWVVKAEGNNLYETWSQINDLELTGKSYVISGNDTTVFEKMRVVSENGKLFYKPTVKGQNEGKEVSFALKSMNKAEIVFENNTHDFPQIISYRRITQDSLVAAISGIQKGKRRTETFAMKRQY